MGHKHRYSERALEPVWYPGDEDEEYGEGVPRIQFVIRNGRVPAKLDNEEVPTLGWLLDLRNRRNPAEPPILWLLQFVEGQYQKKQHLFSCLLPRSPVLAALKILFYSKDIILGDSGLQVMIVFMKMIMTKLMRTWGHFAWSVSYRSSS